MPLIANQRLIQYTNYFLKLLWWLTWLLLVSVLVYEIMLPGHTPRIGIPIRFSLTETGSIPLESLTLDVQLRRAIGELTILNPLPIGFRLWHTLALMSGFFLVLGILYQIRKIFNTLVTGTPFIRANGVRLRWIALLVFLIGLHRNAVFLLYYLLFNTRLHLADIQPRLFEARPGLGFPWSTLTVTVLVLILAEFFRMGAEMAEDQNLTI